MLDRIRWKIAPLIIFIGAGFAFIFSLTIGATWSTGLAASLFVIFFCTVLTVLIMSMLSTRLGEPSFFDGILENSLLVQVRKQQSMIAWTVLSAFVVYISLTILIGIALFDTPVEVSRSFVQSTKNYLIISFIVFICGLLLLFLARIAAEPRLSSKLAETITPELIAKHPQAAIEHAFTIFEDHLRQKIGVGPELYGKQLINQAYGEKGVLRFGILPNEQVGVRNLMDGAYATFRNPRKHRIVNDDEQTVRAIVTLINLMIELVDESQ